MLVTLLAVGMLTSCGVLEEVSESRVPSLGDPGTLTEIFREIGSGEEELSEEMRAVWIAYLDLAPLIKGRTEADFRESFSEMAENCRKAFFNTLVVRQLLSVGVLFLVFAGWRSAFLRSSFDHDGDCKGKRACLPRLDQSHAGYD